MRNVLVAVDDSEASAHVADFVNDFFGSLDVSITAVNIGSVALAWGPYAAAPGMVYQWPGAWAPGTIPSAGRHTISKEGLDAGRDDGARTIRSSGLDADREVVAFDGDVADALRRIADEEGVDLIVVGSSHKGTFERLLSPSVSRDLARSAPVPVLVVH